ncbi:hypothetical protein BT63DRAFT_120646 [Microthyrium microscopicum]|uniref:Defective in cullin neddylation protein n=1 Tax=Microthyrium microscopicum TaxID=703497 RepID=A0A6A6TUI2_9PEZI|nr:hypothetical protein BT63DRAFT_120646 [Microthyrium microscopicum]
MAQDKKRKLESDSSRHRSKAQKMSHQRFDSSAYTTSQKNTIAQFTSVTGAERAQAAKLLKAANWNLQVATNNYYGAAQTAPAQAALEALFEKYRAYGSDRTNMDVTATQRYFTDIGVNFEDASSFVASQIVQSPSLGEVTKEGFVKGWSALSCDTITKQKNAIASYKANLGADTNKKVLENVYKHAFTLLMQSPQQRSADKEACIEIWKILLSAPSLDWRAPNAPWLKLWIDFIQKRQSVKVITRDQWNHVLKFATESMADPTLGFHSEEQSWPSIIDEFAAEMKEYLSKSQASEEMEF